MGAGRLSLSTDAFLAGDLIPALEWAARLGLAGVEVGAGHAAALSSCRDATRDAQAAFKRLNIEPLSLHAWHQVDGLEEVCPFATELGAGLIVVHCPHETIVASLETQAAALRRWDGWCQKHEIILTVENASCQPVAPFMELFKAVPTLALTLDVKHAYKPETLGLTHADYLRELASRVANLHLCGIDRSREDLGDGCPPGRDAVDWRNFALGLAAHGYAGLATVELAYPRHLSVAQIERAYAGLRSATSEAGTLSQRLAAWGVEFFRQELAAILAGGVSIRGGGLTIHGAATTGTGIA